MRTSLPSCRNAGGGVAAGSFGVFAAVLLGCLLFIQMGRDAVE
jgi:hypothetical protein